ncbi:MAG: holin [Anaerolineae bacterium]
MNHFAYLKYYLLDAAERAIKTGAQVAITTLGGDAFSLVNLDSHAVVLIVSGAVVLSVLTSLAQIATVGGGTNGYPGATLLNPPGSVYNVKPK